MDTDAERTYQLKVAMYVLEKYHDLLMRKVQGEMIPLIDVEAVMSEYHALLKHISAPCEKTTKLKALAELCRAIDADTYIIDSQCARDEELLNRWRAAWKREL
jgi:hypothetical protein